MVNYLNSKNITKKHSDLNKMLKEYKNEIVEKINANN